MPSASILLPQLGGQPIGFSPFSAIPTPAQTTQQFAAATLAQMQAAIIAAGGLLRAVVNPDINDMHSLNTVPKLVIAGVPGQIICPVYLQWASNVSSAITTSQSANLKYVGLGNLISAAIATVTTGVTGRKAGTAIMTTITLPAGTDLTGVGMELLGTAACTGGAGVFQAMAAYFLVPGVP